MIVVITGVEKNVKQSGYQDKVKAIIQRLIHYLPPYVLLNVKKADNLKKKAMKHDCIGKCAAFERVGQWRLSKY